MGPYFVTLSCFLGLLAHAFIKKTFGFLDNFTSFLSTNRSFSCLIYLLARAKAYDSREI